MQENDTLESFHSLKKNVQLSDFLPIQSPPSKQLLTLSLRGFPWPEQWILWRCLASGWSCSCLQPRSSLLWDVRGLCLIPGRPSLMDASFPQAEKAMQKDGCQDQKVTGLAHLSRDRTFNQKHAAAAQWNILLAFFFKFLIFCYFSRVIMVQHANCKNVEQRENDKVIKGNHPYTYYLLVMFWQIIFPSFLFTSIFSLCSWDQIVYTLF